jgi:transposase
MITHRWSHVSRRTLCPGVGAILGAVFVAEIGDVHRFPGPSQLTSWAGLTPKHHESDTHVHRGRITKQGSTLVRWATVEAVQRLSTHTRLGQIRDQVGSRRGRNIGGGRRRPRAAHPGLLRAARRAYPLPAPDQRMTFPTAVGRGSCRS